MTLLEKIRNLIRSADQVAEDADVRAAEQELANARTVLAALRERPEWDRQPLELDQAMALVTELEEALPVAGQRAQVVRDEQWRAVYPAAVVLIEAERQALAELPPGLDAQHLAAVTALKAVHEQLAEFESRRAAYTDAVSRVRHIAGQRRESHLIPDFTYPPSPSAHTDTIGRALDVLGSPRGVAPWR